MFVVEFATGSLIRSLINLLFSAIFVYNLVAIGQGIFRVEKFSFKEIRLNVIVLLVAFVTWSFLMQGPNKPMQTISTPSNRTLMEYQHNKDDVVIEPVGPRTEHLEGFSPLKQ